MNALTHFISRQSGIMGTSASHLEAARAGTLHSPRGNKLSVIDYTGPGNRLVETDSGEIVLAEKSLGEIFGERLLKPLIDAVHGVGSAFFQKMGAGWQSVGKFAGRAFSLPSRSDMPVDVRSDQFQISQTMMASVGLNQQPALAISKNGNPVIAWSGVNYAYPSAIAARILHPDGTGLTDEMITNTTVAVGLALTPLAGALPSGDVFVTWPSDDEEGVVVMSGQVVTPQGKIVPSAQYWPGLPSCSCYFSPSSISALQNGNILAVGDIETGCAGGVIAPNGTVLVDWFQFVNNGSPDYWMMSSATLGNGDVFVVWKGDALLKDVIFGCVITPTGTSLAGCGFTISQPVEVSPPFDAALAYPNLVVLPNKNIFVSWQFQTYIYGVPQNTTYSLQGRVMAPDGTPVADQFRVNATVDSSQLTSLMALPDGNIFAVFGDTQNIYGLKLTPSGTYLCDPTQINDDTIIPQVTPVVASLSSGDLFVVWVSQNEAVSGRVVGRILAPDFCRQNSSTSTPSDSSLSKTMIAGIASGGAAGLILLSLGAYAYRRRIKLGEERPLLGVVGSGSNV